MGEQSMGALYTAATVTLARGPFARHLCFAALMASIATVSCNTALPPTKASLMARPECPPVQEETYYFPVESLIPNDLSMDTTQRQALSAYFTAAGVKSLSCGPPGESYRLFWGGGFGVTAVIVTVSDFVATAVQFMPPNEAVLTVSRRASAAVTPANVAQLRDQLDRTSFWKAKPFVDLEGEGTIWLIEARDGDSYKVVTRVTPEPGLAEFARIMVRFSGLTIPDTMKEQANQRSSGSLPMPQTTWKTQLQRHEQRSSY